MKQAVPCLLSKQINVLTKQKGLHETHGNRPEIPVLSSENRSLRRFRKVKPKLHSPGFIRVNPTCDKQLFTVGVIWNVKQKMLARILVNDGV